MEIVHHELDVQDEDLVKDIYEEFMSSPTGLEVRIREVRGTADLQQSYANLGELQGNQRRFMLGVEARGGI